MLKDELLIDPLGIGYAAMSDDEAKDSLNAKTRPANGSVSEMLEYLATQKYRTNTGTDTVNTQILGRLKNVDRSAVGDDPFGSGVLLTLQQIHACTAFMTLICAPQQGAIDLEDANLPFTQVKNAGVWAASDTTALKAISQNRQSRASELGLGKVRLFQVTAARA